MRRTPAARIGGLLLLAALVALPMSGCQAIVAGIVEGTVHGLTHRKDREERRRERRRDDC